MGDRLAKEAWLLWFEDPDRAIEVFTIESFARARLKTCLQSWSCQLFPPLALLDQARERSDHLKRHANELLAQRDELRRELAELRSSPAYHDPGLSRQLATVRDELGQTRAELEAAQVRAEEWEQKVSDMRREAALNTERESMLSDELEQARTRIAELESELHAHRSGAHGRWAK